MTSDAVQQHNTDQYQPGAEQTHNQIPHRGNQCSAGIFGHDNGASRDGTDFDEHVRGKNIVGIGQRQQRCQDLVHHDEIQFLFFRQDIFKNVPAAA